MNPIEAPKPVIKKPIDPRHTHLVAEFKHSEPLTTLRVDPTGRYVAAGAQDLDVQLWSLESGEHHTITGHKSWVRSIDFSSDARFLYTACWGGVVQVRDLSQPELPLVHTIATHRGAARWVRVSPNGQQFATCGNDLLVKLWNAADGQLLQEFAGHERHVYGVDFHPDGEHLVSQDLMGVVKIWDRTTGQAERTIDASVMTGYDNKFAADMGGSRDLQFSPDGHLWASAGITNVTNSFAGIQDPIIVLFDWAKGEIKQKFSPTDNFKGIAWGVRFHPEGFLIGAAANRNGQGELWFYHLADRWFSGPNDAKAFFTFKMKSAARALDLVGDNRLAVAHADGAVRIYEMTAHPELVNKKS